MPSENADEIIGLGGITNEYQPEFIIATQPGIDIVLSRRV